MNISLAFSLFLLIILLYFVMSEFFTALFRFTGLPNEKARFQVISLLTGCGYTTRESEMILSSRGRRRLAMITMLFGYVFNITIVTALINVFFSLQEGQLAGMLGGVLIPLAIVIGLLLLLHFPRIRSLMSAWMEKLAGRVLHLDMANTVLLLDYIGRDSIAQVALREVPEELAGLALSQTGLKTEKNILVLLTEKPGRQAMPATADTVFAAGDKLTVFGRYEEICRVFHARERFTNSAEE